MSYFVSLVPISPTILSLTGSNPRDNPIFEVFLQTGIRVSELCALRLEDIDLPGHILHVNAGKGGKAHTIELEKKGMQAIKNYLRTHSTSSCDEVFLNRYGGPLSERGVRKIVAKYREQAHITKKVSCHGFTILAHLTWAMLPAVPTSSVA